MTEDNEKKFEHQKYRKVVLNDCPEWDYPSFTIPEERFLQITQSAHKIDKIMGGKSYNTLQSGEKTTNQNTTGLMGEYAFARYFGFDIDSVLNVNTKPDDGYDFEGYLPRSNLDVKIEVKTTTLQNGNLLVKPERIHDAEIFFLCERCDRNIALVGYTWYKKLENAEILQSSPANSRIVTRDELNRTPEPEKIRPPD